MVGSVGKSRPPTTHHRSDGPSRRPASQPGRARMTRDVNGPGQSTTSFKPSSATCVSPVRAYRTVGLQRLAPPPQGPQDPIEVRGDANADSTQMGALPIAGVPTGPSSANQPLRVARWGTGEGLGGVQKEAPDRTHFLPRFRSSLPSRDNPLSGKLRGSAVPRDLPVFGISSMCEEGFPWGRGELASAFRLRSSVRKRSRWPLPALTWKHPRIPSARSMAPPNVNVKRLGLSLLRPAILPLLIPPPPGHRPWFQRVAYKVIPTTASRLPPTTNIPNSASRPSGADCSPDVVVWSVLKR